jgi:hypothetical protein
MSIKRIYVPRKKDTLTISELWEDEQNARDILFAIISSMHGKWGYAFCEELRFNIESDFFASAKVMLNAKKETLYVTLCKNIIADLASIACEMQARQE